MRRGGNLYNLNFDDHLIKLFRNDSIDYYEIFGVCSIDLRVGCKLFFLYS